jgi:heme/copper-type cytochrome/quinol oxidase subunit 2
MSHEEKNTILQIIIGAAINIWLILEIRQLYSNGLMDGPAAIQTWAETVFWMIIIAIVAGIGLTVIGTVIFSVIEKINLGEADYSFKSDERDKTIASTGDKITLSIIGTGFIVLILGLKFGYEPIDCLILLMFCFSLGGLAGEMAKLARYRMSF